MVSETELAWAAGFYDGEGCTSMLRTKHHASFRVAIAQKDIRALERFQRAVATDVPIKRREVTTPRGIPSFIHYLHINSQPEAARVLDLMWPYLGPAKREQAERCYSESTWHNGHQDQLQCHNPEHRVAVRSNRRECMDCTNAYSAERRRRLGEVSDDTPYTPGSHGVRCSDPSHVWVSRRSGRRCKTCHDRRRAESKARRAILWPL